MAKSESKQAKCPPTGELKTTVVYSLNGILLSYNKEETLIHKTAWISLKALAN